MLARPSPSPAFFFGDFLPAGVAATLSAFGSSDCTAPSPAPRLFRRAKYPDGRLNPEGCRGATELVEDAAGAPVCARNGAFLLGDNGFGFGFGTSTGGVAGRVSTAGELAVHLPATASRFAGVGLSASASGSRGRLLGEGTPLASECLFGVVRETGSANAAVGLLLVFVGELGAGVVGRLDGDGGRKIDGRGGSGFGALTRG